MPAERSASIAICLPGIASRLKRAATSAMRPAPLVITTKLIDDQDQEDGEADHDLAAHQELAERPDHAARGAVALMAVA